MKNLSIKTTTLQDIPAILELMREFAEHSNLLEYLEVSENALQEVMFSKDAFVRSLLAFAGETPIAYAFFYPTFSSFRGQKSVYLEDIFITSEYRKYGIGEGMLREIARIGKEFGAVRMDFQVLKWNEPAIGFYKKYGVIMDEDERHFKFTDEAFEKLAR
ncbi:MAG: GNAT family N-acetyltransferase [Acidobacteriota bacterium]|jgi:ribosomal protein S18 acetylase RimI-like enzyme|nr:GNAT family N-acetyltransferase [Acidobacteriota bacterium]